MHKEKARHAALCELSLPGVQLLLMPYNSYTCMDDKPSMHVIFINIDSIFCYRILYTTLLRVLAW